MKAKSTTVEIILYYLTNIRKKLISAIYNSRNYSILLNNITVVLDILSTTVEIILYYLTSSLCQEDEIIYNSRNYSILLNDSM